MITLRLFVKFVVCLVLPGAAMAHPAQGGFVLLLPTGAYITAGCMAVALSILVVVMIPDTWLHRLFTPRVLGSPPNLTRARHFTSLIALFALIALLWIGFNGPRDPLSNLLPLAIWTLWWIALFTVQGVVGDVWAWVNPWRGLHALLWGDAPPPFRLPVALGYWPAILAFIAISGFALADLAPDDPARLASFILGYVLFTFAGMALFGPDDWLERAECFTLLLRLFASLSAVQTRPNIAIGLPGWAAQPGHVPLSLGVFVIVLLASGSFDGLNKTFFWLGQIGINPLAFPGRSAVVWPTTLGLIGANIALVLAFFACIATGHLLLRGFAPGAPIPPFRHSAGRLAMSVLPIAFAYHVAHFLTAFLVNIQYSVAAITDPFAKGADYLNLGQFYVTTGFFNTQATVRVIWLSQAGIIVLGHVLAVLMAHRMATQIYGPGKRAVLAQLPLAAFMVLYTLLGLWLLAAPRGA
ncbi:hypothetical protein [Oceaniglobus ichthyenteri]|uniref:hypothetical protein n=1 Tax=Oceaniglobus ichthyenteri TaxID=2136177 RepID=UPI000D3C2C6E|nr:hypothetical protein [Oceaniglobus ichthyenteri]